MASKNQPKSYTPKDGGALVSRADWPLPGFPNYTLKMDFRRDYDQEIRREGNDWYHPNLDAEIANQPFPQRQSKAVGLLNGSFELDDDGDLVPDNWVVVTGPGIGFFQGDVSVAQGFFGRFRPPGVTPLSKKEDMGFLSATFFSTLANAEGWIETEGFLQATPGRSWVVNFQHKVSVPNFKVLVEVHWYNDQLVFLSKSTAYSSTASNPTAFRGMEQRAVVPDGAAFGKLRFYGKDGSHPIFGQIWYDAVSLFEATEGSKPIILLHQARRPNGQTAVIAGTDDTLYRWRAEDDGEYIEDAGGGPYVADDYLGDDYIAEDADPNYVDDDYITNEEGIWEVIGDGFDPNGERWESVNINGWAIFNNSSDLPQTFRVEDDRVFPNYEMREAGIALVGTITDYVGSLICGDVAIIKEDQLEKLFSHIDSGLGTLRQHGAPISTPFTVRADAADGFLIITPVAATPGGLTRSGTVATFTCASAHNLATGQLVKISGATGAAYNGLFVVTVTGPLRFTYTVAGSPASPDPGSPVMQRALFGTAAFNYTWMAFKEIFTLNGWRSVIQEVVDPVKIRIGRSTAGWVGDHLFLILNNVTRAINGAISKNGTVNVTGVGSMFTTETYPGQSILIPGGAAGDEIRVVESITSDLALTVTKPFVGVASGQPLFQMSDYLLISDDDFFTVDAVGRLIFFDDGSTRKITLYRNPRWVETDSFLAVPQQQFKLENTAAYGPIENASLYDRVQYRRVWSDIDEPLRFAASTPGTIRLGSRNLELKYQRRSFQVGDSIIIVGAGTAGGNLTAKIASVHPNHTSFTLDRAAETTSVDQPVARSDASGTISGFDDLQDDGSPIVKMLDLRGTLVSYKETAIFLTTYTGDASAPFTAVRRYQGSKTPFYRDTLINVEGRFHLYAGRTSFYSFDLVAQSPQEFNPLEACHDLFYSQVMLDNRKLIFSFRNVLTKEIFFCFPSTSPHHALCYDFKLTQLAPAGSVSTTSEQYTAGAWIKKPLGGPVIGMTEDWVILGGPTGIVMRYGLADDPDPQFAGGKAIFNRLGSGYESRLRGGLYGDRFHETTMAEWMAELATQDFPTLTGYTFNLYGYRNSAEAARLIMTTPLPLPATDNLVPMLFREHYFQDEIVVTGANNPLRLAARTVVFSKQGSRGVQKAGLT